MIKVKVDWKAHGNHAPGEVHTGKVPGIYGYQ